ncbi:plant self-incompatibility protein S1 family protein, partial [Tanacetum coccineum]
FSSTDIPKTPPSGKLFEPYRVTITNGGVPDVVVGCDERGADLLTLGNEISWVFRMNYRGTTSYNCRFYWFDENNSTHLRKSNAFPVFDKSIIALCGSNLFKMNRCH